MTIKERIDEALKYLKDRLKVIPQIGIVLGSGLKELLVGEIEDKLSIPYQEIPYFPLSTVEGHPGNLVTGKLMGKEIALLQGRVHYYEGYSMQQVTFPIRTLRFLGVNRLIVTNAAGGINKDYRPGDIVLITDHINFMGNNPLIGLNEPELGPRFPDMSEAYSLELIALASKVAKKEKVKLKKGVYMGLMGPSYETPAEVRMAKILGADLVGMSTVPEVIVANYIGMLVLGVSFISNMAAGISKRKTSHEEVLLIAQRVKDKLTRLLRRLIEEI